MRERRIKEANTSRQRDFYHAMNNDSHNRITKTCAGSCASFRFVPKYPWNKNEADAYGCSTLQAWRREEESYFNPQHPREKRIISAT